MQANHRTCVSVSWAKNRRNHRLLFGTPLRWVRLDWRRRIAVFEAGNIFGYERWTATPYGTASWQIYILRAGQSGDTLSSVSGVRPGAFVLLQATGKDAATRVLNVIGTLKDTRPLEQVTAEQWHSIASKLAAGLPVYSERLVR